MGDTVAARPHAPTHATLMKAQRPAALLQPLPSYLLCVRLIHPLTVSFAWSHPFCLITVTGNDSQLTTHTKSA